MRRKSLVLRLGRNYWLIILASGGRAKVRQLFLAVDRCRDRSGRSPDRLSRVHRPSIAKKGCLNEQPLISNRGVEKRKTDMVTSPNAR